MGKRILSAFLTAAIIFTSVHVDAFALADTYNAENYIVDKTEEVGYGGSHLVITNSGDTSQTVKLPAKGSLENINAMMNVSGGSEDGVYGYDQFGQGLIEPSTILPDIDAVDLEIPQSVSEDEGIATADIMSSFIGEDVYAEKKMYLMTNPGSENVYLKDCVRIAVGEHCTVWIPTDDPYYLSCLGEATTVDLSVEESGDKSVSDNDLSHEMEETTVSGNALLIETDEVSVSDNEVLFNTTSVTSDDSIVAVMEEVAAEFDDKYEKMVTMFGDSDMADAYGDGDGKVAIICYDIQGDYGASTYVGGYFWSGDLYYNKMDCIHIDSYQGMNRPTKEYIDPDYIENCYATLVHEYQHMIHFSHLMDKELDADYTPTYINEVFSAAAEYLLSNENEQRYLYYNSYSSFTNGLSLVQWDTNEDVLMNYSVAYLFAQYLRTQYEGGSTIYKDAMDELSAGEDLLDIIAQKIGMTSEDIWLNFRAALELKNPSGPYGFAGETDFTKNFNSKIYTGSADSITLAPGGSVVVAIDEPYIPSDDVGTDIKYLGIDLGKKEKDIFISFVAGESSVIDTYAGTLELKANVSPFYLSQDVTYSIVEGEKYATLSDNVLTAMEDGVVTVRATWNEREEIYKDHIVTISNQGVVTVIEESTGNEKAFTTFDNAISNLDSVAEKKAGTYTFVFEKDVVMTADATLPAYVTEAVFTTADYIANDTGSDEGAQGENARLFVGLDLCGNKLSTAGKLVIEEGLVLSDSEGGAALDITKNNAASAYKEAFLIFNISNTETSFVDLAGVEISADARAQFIQDVTVSAPNTTVEFKNDSGNAITYVTNSKITANTLRIPAGAWYLKNVSNIKDMQLLTGAVLLTDDFTQISSGKAYLWAGSIFVINDSATIYNPVLNAEGEDGTPVYIHKTNTATIDILGTVTRNAQQTQISFGKMYSAATDAEDIELEGYSAQTALFDTTNAAFPLEIICTTKAAEGGTSSYNMIYKVGDTVYVGVEGIIIKSVGVSDGEKEVLKTFAKWSEAAKYLDTLANTPMEYVVEFSEKQLDINEALTLPAKVNGITFRGVSADGSATRLTYTEDIRLASNTTFENIDLVAKKYDSKTKTYIPYKSTVTLNGKTLMMKNSSADFTSITGNNKSKVVLESSKVSVAKAVSSLGFLDMVGEADISTIGEVTVDTMLSADSVTVTDTLTMQSAEIDCTNKLALKNIVSNDEYNKLSYGGNSSTNGLTISGNISASYAGDMVDEEVTINRTEGTVEVNKTTYVRKNAIQLCVESMEPAGYMGTALLCNAEKAGSGWFVVGTKWEDDVRIISFGTYKSAKTIYCGEAVENVKLYSSNSENGMYAYESGFDTLQEALTEIDKLAVKDAYYRIEIVSNTESVTCKDKAPVFPSKTAGITIAKGNMISSVELLFKGNLSLKSNTSFEDIVFVPQTKSSISLGNYMLRLSRCDVDEDRYEAVFSGITGTNVNGNSALILDDTELHVAGNVNNVGMFVFTGEEISTFALLRMTPAYPTLIADGTVNVGTVELKKDGRLTGLATVTRKGENITKITPQITINKDVYSANDNTLYLDLQEKISNQFVLLDFSKSEMKEISKAGIPLAKALCVTYPYIEAYQGKTGTTLTKAGSYLTYFEDGFGVVLSYRDDAGAREIKIPCRTFADAVTEINNQKSKRAYTITLLEKVTETSGVDSGSGDAPKALNMPNRSYVDTLTIQADPDVQDSSVIQLGFINNITLTSNVILENVNFVQMIKVDSVYQTADFAKDKFPVALTFNTAGYDIAIKGSNTFNTPVIMNGSNKSSLVFDENGTITTFTNDYDPEDIVQNNPVVENVIYGMLSGFNTVTVEDSNLTLYAYKSSREAISYTESNNRFTTVNVSGSDYIGEGGKKYSSGNIGVVSEASKAEFACTNYNSNNGNLLVDGKISLKNVSLEGESAPTIQADTNFDITGILISGSNTAILNTRLKGAGKEPYLNVSGTVDRVGNTESISVGVYPEITIEDKTQLDKPVNMKKTDKGYLQLLAAKSAQAKDFRPVGDNYSGGEFDAMEYPGGYMMLKSNGKIYVYDGTQVHVAVYKGGYTGTEADDLLGYYPSFKEASSDVDSLKNKNQDYVFVLTKQNGTLITPIGITLPSQANSVAVTNLADGNVNKVVYLSGNVTLNCDTVFENIEFAPVYKGAGTVFNIAADGNDLKLRNVTVMDEKVGLKNAALKDITGNGKQTITLASPDLEMKGGISNALRVEVVEKAEMKGNLKTTVLSLSNNEQGDEVTFSVDGTITIDTLENSDDIDSKQNVLKFTRNSSNVTNLTINKEIENTGDIVVLKQNDKNTLSVLSEQSGKVILVNAAKVMTLPKASTDSFVFEGTCAVGSQTFEYVGNNVGYTVVKADNGVYIADSSLQNDIVQLKRTISESADVCTTFCLDYSQAINEINNIADMESSYLIQFQAAGSEVVGTSEIDTNVKDDNSYGSFTLPKSNAKKDLTVMGITGMETVIPFTGNISGQGTITLKNLVLNPVKGGKDSTPADTNISVTADKTTPQFNMESVSTKVKSAEDVKDTGFITNISGTRNKTDVYLRNCNGLIVKNGITNVNEISLDGTELLSDGTVAINRVELLNNASWNSLGKTTITDVRVESPVDEISTSYIGTKQDRNRNPQLVLNGEVNGGILLCKVYTADTSITDADEIFILESNIRYEKEPNSYLGVPLVSAKYANADRFRAYSFRDENIDGVTDFGNEGITKDNLASYKDGVYVKNANKNQMQLMLSEYENLEMSDAISVSYAETFEDAVTTINNKADNKAYYKIQFIKAGDSDSPVVIKTTKRGMEYGAITLPSKAAGVTISGYRPENESNVEPCTIIKYTGTLKASCDVTFENILLTEGAVDKSAADGDGFVENGIITPTPTANKTITFERDVYTYQNSIAESIAKDSNLVTNAVSAGKGNLVFRGNKVFSDKTITIGSLALLEGASLNVTGKTAITDLCVDEKDNKLSSKAAISIGNVLNRNAEDENAAIANVTIQSDFTKITKAGDYGNSQLTVSGLIEDVNVKLNYNRYNFVTSSYIEMDEKSYAGLLMKADGKPDAYKKLATVPKASLDWITVTGGASAYSAYNHDDENVQTYLYKYDTGLYLTNVKPVVMVSGYESLTVANDAYTEDNLCYQAEFLSWDQAVKEIDKIGLNSRCYELKLLDTIGMGRDKEDKTYVDVPITTVTMPSKAKEVLITSEEEEHNGIFFTDINMILKCPTRMENIGFTCVKKYTNGSYVYYLPVTYTMNVGNYELVQQNMVDVFDAFTDAEANENMKTVPYAISGSAKGVFRLVSETESVRQYDAIKGLNELEVEYTNASANDSGYENLVLDCAGDISVKNLMVRNSMVEAKNITVSTLATLDEASLQAGTSAANDGKLTIKDIKLADDGNALTAEQNKNGVTQIVINGIVTAADDLTPAEEAEALSDGTITLKLYYNNYQKKLFWWLEPVNNSQKPAQLYDGMILCTASKAASNLFVPAYTVKANVDTGISGKDGMGLEYSNYGTYKSGKNICYGKTMDTTGETLMEASLTIGDSGMTTYFRTFEEAVKEIDSLCLYQDPTAKTKVYEDYKITLLKNVEIGNAKNNNSFSTLAFPSKAKELVIDGNANEENNNQGYTMSFANNVTVKCNTKLADVILYPIKNVKGAGVPTAVNYSIGNYTLELDNVISETENGASLIGNISGSSKTGTLKLAAGAEGQVNDIDITQLSGLREVVLEERTKLKVAKTCSVYQISFANSELEGVTDEEISAGTVDAPAIEAEELPALSVDGVFTVTLLNAKRAGAADDVYGIISKPIASKMTVNGLYNSKTKEYASVLLPEDGSAGQIKVEVVGSPCTPGTLVLTGKYLNLNEVQNNFKVVSKNNEESADAACTTYSKGTSLYIAEKAE